MRSGTDSVKCKINYGIAKINVLFCSFSGFNDFFAEYYFVGFCIDLIEFSTACQRDFLIGLFHSVFKLGFPKVDNIIALIVSVRQQ